MGKTLEYQPTNTRKNPKEMTAKAVIGRRRWRTSPATAAAPDVPMGKDRVAHQPPVAGEIRQMTIKEMGNFEYDAEKGGIVPADVWVPRIVSVVKGFGLHRIE